MPVSKPFVTILAAATATAASCYVLWIQSYAYKKQKALKTAPRDLDTWRVPDPELADGQVIWADFEKLLSAHGYTPWHQYHFITFHSPGGRSYTPSPSGFAYVRPTRAFSDSGPGTLSELTRFYCLTPLSRAIRTPDGRDAVIRIIKIRNEGQEHLSILRKIARSPQALLSTNHTLPMWTEFELGHLVFGVFPLVGFPLNWAFDYWAKNSVGDVMDMLMQALEGLAFIHNLNIAHRDAFYTNFVVEYYPESLLSISPSRPRVYLIDFEVAIQFPDDSSPEDRVCVGLPLGGSFPEEHMYTAPRAPEMLTGAPYSPFKLDVWQFGTSFVRYKTNVPQLDEVLEELRCPDYQARPSARDALTKMITIVNGMPPASLLIAGEILPCSEPGVLATV